MTGSGENSFEAATRPTSPALAIAAAVVSKSEDQPEDSTTPVEIVESMKIPDCLPADITLKYRTQVSRFDAGANVLVLGNYQRREIDAI